MTNTSFITGGTGLLALNWAAHKRAEQSIYLVQHTREVSLDGTSLSSVDLANKQSLINELQQVKPDLVVHAAGLTSVEQCEGNPALAHKANTELSANVACACHELGIKLVHISTDHLFAGQSAMVTEEEPVAPLNQYAKTKAEAEQVVLASCPNALVVRTNIYGWGMSYRNSFSDFVLDNLSARTPISLFEDVFFTPILIADLVDVIEDLVAKQQSGIFNVAGSERVSKLQMGTLLARHFELDTSLIQPVSISEKANLVIRPKDMSLSTQKAASIIGRELPNAHSGIEKLKQQKQQGLAKELRAL